MMMTSHTKELRKTKKALSRDVKWRDVYITNNTVRDPTKFVRIKGLAIHYEQWSGQPLCGIKAYRRQTIVLTNVHSSVSCHNCLKIMISRGWLKNEDFI